jgi:hypothetical protein
MLDTELPYIVIYTDERTRRGHLSRVVAARGPMTLEQAHTVLDISASSQETGFGREYKAQIVAYGDPFGVGDPWELDDEALEAEEAAEPTELDLLKAHAQVSLDRAEAALCTAERAAARLAARDALRHPYAAPEPA